ncbi:MAG: hypothetical protein SOY49_12405 [Prevotella sp.]|nr:hypothetical protein [Prevotella sp.]
MRKSITLIILLLSVVLSSKAIDNELRKNTVLWFIDNQQGKELIASELFMKGSHIKDIKVLTKDSIPELFQKEGITVILKIKILPNTKLIRIDKYAKGKVKIISKYYPSQYPIFVEKGYKLKSTKHDGQTVIDIR